MEHLKVESTAGKYSLVVHGGANNLSERDFVKLQEFDPVLFGNLKQRIRRGLSSSCQAGEQVLRGGGSAREAVLAAITCLENDELFNAGKGSCIDRHGKYRMDASIQDGDTRDWGSVALVDSVTNPIQLANECLVRGGLFLAGRSTTSLAKKSGMGLVNNDYFHSEYRIKLREFLKTHHIELAGGSTYLGTVGAVARDINGTICAGTSTGGIPFKPSGRIGDTPMIGISTVADSRYCGISCTGIGERIVRETLAHDIKSQMEYLGTNLSQAISHSISKIPDYSAGVIGIDATGEISVGYNTRAMFRATANDSDSLTVSIW